MSACKGGREFGGMPMPADVGLEIDQVTAVLDGVYSAAVVNDILEHEKREGRERQSLRTVGRKSVSIHVVAKIVTLLFTR